MYPQTYLSLFPPFPRVPKAFVAMSFASEFTPRWENVLRPGLKRLATNGTPLDPYRVDLSKASDAILTEILQGISDATVIVADVTSMGLLNDRAVRNANVLYEVGIAHASRRPEEVVLFRSDNHPLDFDVQGVRVHTYDPDANPGACQRFVANTVFESLQTLDDARRTAIRLAAQRLTLPAFNLLFELRKGDVLEHPVIKTIGQSLGMLERVRAIELLLELGVLEARPIKLTTEWLDTAERDPQARIPMLRYSFTGFGKALTSHVMKEMVPLDKDLVSRIAHLSSASTAEASSQVTNLTRPVDG